MTPCAICGGSLRPRDNGRPRTYCSSACRTKAWRNRSVTKPIDGKSSAANLRTSRTDCPPGSSDTGPQLRPRPRRSAL